MEPAINNTNFFPDILFEDNHLIVINKKPGEIVQGDKTGDTNIGDVLKNYLKEKYNKPGNVFIGTVHRIDRPVSGIVIFAKTSKALERMNEMLREKKLQKTYWAVVKNKPQQNAAVVEGYLKKNEAKNKSFVFKTAQQGALHSILEYEIIVSSDNYHLLKINPVTGRHHQIRALLSHIGSPIKGDLKYGSQRSNKDGSIHLHARAVKFIHPVTKEEIGITCPPPNESLWNYFSESLSKSEKR